MHISYFTRKILLDYEDGQYSTPMIAINRSLIKYRKMNRMSKEKEVFGWRIGRIILSGPPILANHSIVYTQSRELKT